MRKILLIIGLCFLPLNVYAHDKPHEPTPLNVPDDGSNHNALAIAVIIGLGICAYHRCWESKESVKVSDTMTPEVPQNEYMRIRRETKP